MAEAYSGTRVDLAAEVMRIERGQFRGELRYQQAAIGLANLLHRNNGGFPQVMGMVISAWDGYLALSRGPVSGRFSGGDSLSDMDEVLPEKRLLLNLRFQALLSVENG